MSKDTKFSALVTYFEKLASEHIAIQHNEVTGNKRFFRFELDEVLSGLSSAMNFPCLILEGYAISFTDNKSDNPIKTRDGAFILLDHVSDIGDYNLIHQVWDNLEVVGDDFIARIKSDKRNPLSPIRDFNIEDIEANLIATEFGNLYGIRYSFSASSRANLTLDPDRWITTPII